MMIKRRSARWAIAAALMMPVVAQAQTQGDTLAIEHVTVIPMARDTSLADHTVLMWGGRIGWIGPSRDARVPAGAARVDGRGQWLIPGLADMHVHLDRFDDLPGYLEAGVTTVRNMRGRPEHLAWRADIERGVLAGPTIFTSGPTCCRKVLPFMTNPAFVRIRTEADADSLARQQARAGYDMIKLHSGISVSKFERLTAAARAAGIPVVGHLVPEIGLTKSLSSGQVSLEHADGLVEGDSVEIGAAFGAIARSGAWVGTIISSRNGECGPPRPVSRRNIAALRRAGVKLLAGSDAGLEPVRPGVALHCELATLVAAGLTPYQALATATANAGAFAAAHLKARVPFGTVAVGARADLVLLSANPLSDIGAVGHQVGVVSRGRWRSARR